MPSSSSYVQFGNPLTTLVEQPGASFKRTRSGFDTGRRTFKCNTSAVSSLIPAFDYADATYSRMYVVGVEERGMGNGESEVAVEYSGLMTGTTKEKTFDISYIRETRTMPFTNGTVAFWYRGNMIRPSVSSTYVTTLQPVTSDLGTRIAPDITSVSGALIPIVTSGYYVLSAFFKDQGWVLINRTVKKAGPLFEVTDEHEYVYTADQAATA